jgi:DNA-binding winged helix-turn-helix (wHTH) protein
MRLGIYLPSLKAAILDAVKAAGDVGIGRDELLNSVYQGRKQPSPLTLKAHINQLNDRLAETEFTIKADGRRFHGGARYYLLRERGK